VTATPEPRSFLGACLVRLGYSHDTAEQLVQAALDRHAHELAEQQRREMRAPGRSYDASRWNRVVDMTADLIDPGMAVDGG
jgi:hypothetical protein